MKKNDFIWGMLIHLGGNMWNEEGNTRTRETNPDGVASSKLRFSRPLWDKYLLMQKEAGVNMIILDLGEGLRYESHPELAVEGSWSRAEMEEELIRLRGMGFEVIPKLNFSAGHDVWLGEYSRMVSTSIYYRVCADLIHEVCDIFKPRFLHLGMDEEVAVHQGSFLYAVARQHELWWHDFYYLVDLVEKENVRTWIWSDYMWNHREEYLQKMPKSVLQSNWYYDMEFEEPNISPARRNFLECFDLLDKYGFDQVPTGSNYYNAENMEALTKYCTKHLSSETLCGFMQTPWKLMVERNWERLTEASETLKSSKVWYDTHNTEFDK